VCTGLPGTRHVEPQLIGAAGCLQNCVRCQLGSEMCSKTVAFAITRPTKDGMLSVLTKWKSKHKELRLKEALAPAFTFPSAGKKRWNDASSMQRQANRSRGHSTAHAGELTAVATSEADLFSSLRDSKFFKGAVPANRFPADQCFCTLCERRIHVKECAVEELHREEQIHKQSEAHFWGDNWKVALWCTNCIPVLEKQSSQFSMSTCQVRREICVYKGKDELLAACSANGLPTSAKLKITELQGLLEQHYAAVARLHMVPTLVLDKSSKEHQTAGNQCCEAKCAQLQHVVNELAKQNQRLITQNKGLVQSKFQDKTYIATLEAEAENASHRIEQLHQGATALRQPATAMRQPVTAMGQPATALRQRQH
jgi:hypothetical protein